MYDKDTKKLSKIIETIIHKEKELDKITKKIIGSKIPIFETKNENVLKNLKLESISKAKELYELYKEKRYKGDMDIARLLGVHRSLPSFYNGKM